MNRVHISWHTHWKTARGELQESRIVVCPNASRQGYHLTELPHLDVVTAETIVRNAGAGGLCWRTYILNARLSALDGHVVLHSLCAEAKSRMAALMSECQKPIFSSVEVPRTR